MAFCFPTDEVGGKTAAEKVTTVALQSQVSSTLMAWGLGGEGCRLTREGSVVSPRAASRSCICGMSRAMAWGY